MFWRHKTAETILFSSENTTAIASRGKKRDISADFNINGSKLPGMNRW